MTQQRRRKALLPESFADLEPYVADWALKTEAERAARRKTADMRAIKAFYEAMLARLDDALHALGGRALNDLTATEVRLYYMTLSLCEVAPAVELYKQQQVIDGFDPARFPRVDVPNMGPPEA